MTRSEFIGALAAAFTAAGVPVRRYLVEPGLEDLELDLDERTVRLRIVRTGPR